jgi:hypothetical protein
MGNRGQRRGDHWVVIEPFGELHEYGERVGRGCHMPRDSPLGTCSERGRRSLE